MENLPPVLLKPSVTRSSSIAATVNLPPVSTMPVVNYQSSVTAISDCLLLNMSMNLVKIQSSGVNCNTIMSNKTSKHILFKYFSCIPRVSLTLGFTLSGIFVNFQHKIEMSFRGSPVPEKENTKKMEATNLANCSFKKQVQSLTF
jgi:hypothetical protein